MVVRGLGSERKRSDRERESSVEEGAGHTWEEKGKGV